MVVLESAGFSVAENETKRKVHLENGQLISKDPAQLLAEAGRTDSREAEIVPVLKLVFEAETGADLGPVLMVDLSNIFFTTGDKVSRNEDRIFLPTGASDRS